MLSLLTGCRWGCGDANVKLKPHKMSAMLHRANKIGLKDPVQILNSQFNAAKSSMTQYDQKSRALLRGCPSRALLAEPDENEDAILFGDTADREEGIIVDRTRTRQRCTIIVRTRNLQVDDESDDDSDGSIYEL